MSVTPVVLPDPEEYLTFFWKTNDLLSELMRFRFALRTVGACGPGIQAIHAMYESFEALQCLFRNNMYSLHPTLKADPRFNLLQTQDVAYLAHFPKTLEAVSEALRDARNALEDFHTVYYQDNLKYLLECLEKRFKSEAEQMSMSMSKGIDFQSSPSHKRNIQLLLGAFLTSAVIELRAQFSTYCDKGIPVISSMQEKKAARYLNLTTIATFLSGVTASLLQISTSSTTGAVAVGVDTFLFASLTFSIASAISSLLTMTWLKAVVRDPTTHMPLWLKSCIISGPMISLVISVVLFGVALSLFVFSSGQHIVTKVLTIFFAGFCALGLILIGVSFMIEKWNFRKTAGSVGQDITEDSLSMAIFDWIVISYAWFNEALSDGLTAAPTMMRRLGGASQDISHSRHSVISNSFEFEPSVMSVPKPVSEAPSEIEPFIEYQSLSADEPMVYEPVVLEDVIYEPVVLEPVVSEDVVLEKQAVTVRPPYVDSQNYKTSLFLPHNDPVVNNSVSVFAAVDQSLSDRIAKAIGYPSVQPLKVKSASEAVQFKVQTAPVPA